MKRKLLLLSLLSFLLSLCAVASAKVDCPLSSRIRVRVLTGNNPQYLFFTVLSGKYSINNYSSDPLVVSEGDVIVLTLYNNKVAVKTRNNPGYAADSIYIGETGTDNRFSLRTSAGSQVSQIYAGDLQCIPDMGSLMFINICDLETYIAGVVKAEGGSGKKEEYFRTQAIIARTYTYRYFNRHLPDGFNLCDDTHCQVFNGITGDSLIIKAVNDTKDMVIVTPDSNLIIAAFHSNCGGETSPSEYIWPAKQSYLVKVSDPYCLKSRSATWQKIIPLKTWIEMLGKNGYTGTSDSTADFSFSQPSRMQEYVTGSFRLPFSRIRNDLDLRSSWFSVKAVGDSLLLTGRGYGHGVGLCQEGAMVMAGKGLGYKDIISFYYPGVMLLKISDAKKSGEDNVAVKNKQGN
jgi:stage II sporulation protein D